MLMILYVVVGKAGGSSAMGILAFAVIVGVGNVSMPLAVLAGWIQLPPGVAS